MAFIHRYLFVTVMAALLLFGCSSPAQKQTSTADSQTSVSADYLGQGPYTGSYWPTGEWRQCSPEAVGMRSEKLLAAIAYAATPGFNTDGLVIVRKAHIVGEAYFGNFRIDSKHVSHSMAKSFTSCLVGIAIDKGLIAGVDERVCRYYDEWDCNAGDDLRSRITLRHAMTLTTGLEWHEDWSRWEPATNDALKMGASNHFVQYMAGRRGLYEPGRRFVYSTGDPMLLSMVIQQSTGMSALEFARQNLFEPLNIANVSWDHDADGYTSTAWGLYATVRDYAKFGYLFLNRGRWESRQVVSAAWVEKSTRPDPSVKMWAGYGYLWHVNLPYRLQCEQSPVSLDAIPHDGYMAQGIRGPVHCHHPLRRARHCARGKRKHRSNGPGKIPHNGSGGNHNPSQLKKSMGRRSSQIFADKYGFYLGIQEFQTSLHTAI